MPRGRRMRDRAMMRDGRNPYGSRGGYVSSDRAMDYARRDYRGSDYEYGSARGDRAYSEQDNARGRRDYEQSRQYDMGYESNVRGRNSRDGHYPMSQGSTYYPIEAMGTFNGYYGMPQDYNSNMRGYDGYWDRETNRELFESDMRGRGYGDYRYDYAGDYGESLTKEELEHWKKKLMKELDDKDKQFFSKETIGNKAKQMGVKMEGFNEDELLVTTLMMYTDYCKVLKNYVGNNMDIYIMLAKSFLMDSDASVKGGEKLAVYYDNIVADEEDED